MENPERADQVPVNMDEEYESPFVDMKALCDVLIVAGRSGVKQMSWQGFQVEFYRPAHREEPGTVDGTDLDLFRVVEPSPARPAGAGAPDPAREPSAHPSPERVKEIREKERAAIEQRFKQEELDALKLNDPVLYEEMLIKGDLLPDERVTVDDGKEV